MNTFDSELPSHKADSFFRILRCKSHLHCRPVVVAVQYPNLRPVLGEDFPSPSGVRLCVCDPRELTLLLGNTHFIDCHRPEPSCLYDEPFTHSRLRWLLAALWLIEIIVNV